MELPTPPHKSAPKLTVVMGVSGTGKTTVARALAERCNLRFLDADDFHSEESRARMRRGIPLNDELRAPWIKSICSHLRELSKRGENCVLAYSGLKKTYRDPLRNTGFDVTFLFLDGNRDLIRQRMRSRQGHFMPAGLLDSQYESLERPQEEPDVFQLDVTCPLEDIIRQAAERLR